MSGICNREHLYPQKWDGSAAGRNEDAKKCVVATSVPQARDQSTDITRDARDPLVEIYDALSDGIGR